ncbi:MAG: fasciclin domain-containing protein [Dietzia sp.]|uniref:fasciclin domain-containing protein n=1 Tax=Dietzia sp. TaxID=1871616 RepID=UPI00271E90D1|nr:fasciclin domain-containing protein [Dietzia sp.]MDO8393810.1 fasciclin domain-containing protein [Dietzia sp.]
MKRTIAVTGAIGLAVFMGACGTDDTADDATTTEETTMTTEMTTEETTEEEMTEESAATGNIVETAMAAGNFTTLTQALEAAGLVETLEGPGPFTVFAPTDEAFAALPDGQLDELLADPTGDLAQILQFHVIEGDVMAEDVMGMDGDTVETLQGAEFTIEVEGETVMLVDGAGNRITVIQTDVPATNGVIHAIDGVMMPPA